MIKSITRHREFTGDTPHNVAILARPTNKIPAEHLILERRRIEDLREKSIAETKYNKQCDLKSAWERATDKQIQKNCVKREMARYLQKEQITLEMRREKLRDMLLAEEEKYIEEMEAMEETIEERQQNMKSRAKYLKEKRKSERLACVEDKMDQKFRQECEELRSELSKQTRDEIFKDRGEQIRMKAERKQREAEFEQFYANMWEQDTKAKAVREEIETKEQIKRNRSALEILNLQKMAISTQREEEKEMKKMEAEWLKEEAALRAYEEEQLMNEKRQKQRAARRARDISIKLKNRKEAKEKQEQIAMDMKMLEKVLEDTENQAVEDLNKKKQMHEEMQRFMHYVDNTRKEELEKEKQLEQLINEDVEIQWKKKDAKKRLEKNSRKMLMENVLQTREMQIKERNEILRNEHEAALREKKELHDEMEEHRRLENERINRIRNENRKYQNDIEQQINYQRQLKMKEIEEARKELGSLHEAETTYQRKLRSALANPDLRKLHPLRVTGFNTMSNRAKTC